MKENNELTRDDIAIDHDMEVDCDEGREIAVYDAEGRASVLSGQPDQYLGAVLRQHRDQDPPSDDGAFFAPRY